jgi:Zn-dependent M28 family amino/carboxypeptidase
MPILTYDFEDVVAFGAEHSTLGAVVERAVARDRVKLSPDPTPEEGLFTRSDHYMFVREGIPSVFLVTGHAGPGKAAVESFIGNHYHRVTDDMKLPLNWNAGAKFARINYLIAREIADAPAAPLWYDDSFFGKMFATGQKKASRPR